MIHSTVLPRKASWFVFSIVFSATCCWQTVHAQIFDTVYTPSQHARPYVFAQPDSTIIGMTVRGKDISPSYYNAVFDLQSLSLTQVSTPFATGDYGYLHDGSVFVKYGDEHESHFYQYHSPTQIQYLKSENYTAWDYFTFNGELVGYLYEETLTDVIDRFVLLDSSLQVSDTLLTLDSASMPYGGGPYSGGSGTVQIVHVFNDKIWLLGFYGYLNPYKIWPKLIEWRGDTNFTILHDFDTLNGNSLGNFKLRNNRLFFMESYPGGSELHCFDMNFDTLFTIEVNHTGCYNGVPNYDIDRQGNILLMHSNPPINGTTVRNTTLQKFGPDGTLQWIRCVKPEGMPDSSAKVVTLTNAIPMGDTAYAFVGNNYYEVSDGNDSYGIRVLILDTAGTYPHTLGTGELSVTKGALLFPNPASSNLTVRWSPDWKAKGILSIVDVQGNELKRLRIEQGLTETQLSIGDFPKGMYVVKLVKGQDVWSDKLLVH